MNASGAIGGGGRPRRCGRPAGRRSNRFATSSVDGGCPGARHRVGTRRGRPGHSPVGFATAHRRVGGRPRQRRDRGVDARRRARRIGRRTDRRRRRRATMDRCPRRPGGRRRRPRRRRHWLPRRHGSAPRRSRRRGGPVRRSAARRYGRSVGGAAAATARDPTTSPWFATWPPGWPHCRRSPRATPSIWRRWPTSWTPRRSETVPAVTFSPIRPRGWPSACSTATWCSPATPPPPWRWPGTRPW